ncbi:MAG: DUF427 domain-containing protein [Spirochaetales bacterium]|nr:DUF427 domain-containing protein [Leptospiraceae bacterium]MCP5480739.1 DUF427 domain-containing protein [Spirochaetales bacterium]MCP5484091.1 DUF427 domain-containing protein [Spirochaetales bacterium]
MKPDVRIKPGPGQESVWDYPRPPRLEATARRLEVFFAGQKIADTSRGYRVLETSHPPTYYFPSADVEMRFLKAAPGSSFCEWKGQASYFDIVVSRADSGELQRAGRAAWTYAGPSRSFTPIRNHISFYAHLMDRCLVDGEPVRPQAGGFYGGWVTNDLVGPFKGEPGTLGW